MLALTVVALLLGFSPRRMGVSVAEAQQGGGLLVNPSADLDGPARAGALAGAAQFQRDRTIVRSRFADVDFALLGGAETPETAPDAWRPGTLLQLNLFADVGLTALLDHVERNPSGTYSWVGSVLSDPLSSVTFVVNDGIVVGNVNTGNGAYEIRPAGATHIVHQIDQSLYPPEREPIPVDAPAGEVAGDVVAADDGSWIDLMIVWTPSARTAAGGTGAIEALADLSVTETNTAYANSGITPRVRLVHKEEVTYTEHGADVFGTALSELTATADGVIDGVHTLRNTYGADAVQMLINDTAFCGLAWRMTTESAGFASSAFSVVAYTCATGYYSAGHELGHNQGAHHDHYVVGGGETQLFPYNFGYVYIGATVGLSWRTIMGYGNQCADTFGSSCTRIQYFSNPAVSYSGHATGVGGSGSTAADNHLTLDNTADTVSSFRSTVVLPDAATLVSPTGGASTGDTTPTYTWNAVSGATWYYLWVEGPTGDGVVIQQWVTATTAGCAAGTGTCSMTPSTTLFGGAHHWWIRSWNTAGNGPWSAPGDFTVSAPPGATTLVSPIGNTVTADNTPTYTWNAVPGSTWYYLWVDGPGGNVMKTWFSASQVGCPSGTGSCSTTPSTVLADGDHDWWVQTWNSSGTGPWSARGDFTVTTGPPAAATLVSPSGTIGDNTPTYTWNAVSGSTWYYLWVDGPSGDVILQWVTAAGAGCPSGTGTCSYTPSTVLADGVHKFWIRTWNSSGSGPWSTFLSFTVAASN